MVTPCLDAHFISFSLMYSGPLSTLIVAGTASFADAVQAADDAFGGQ